MRSNILRIGGLLLLWGGVAATSWGQTTTVGGQTTTGTGTTSSLGTTTGGSTSVGGGTSGGASGATGAIGRGTAGFSLGGSFGGGDPTSGFIPINQQGTVTNSNSAIDQSNVFNQFYRNPLGIGLNQQINAQFGQPRFNGTGTGVGGARGGVGTNAAAGRGTQTRGGTTNAAINRQTRSVQNRTAIVNHTAALGFRHTRIDHSIVHANVQQMIANSTRLTNPGSIEVHRDGNQLILRGQVVSEREAKIAVGLVRLTPGVREIRNELTVKP